MKTFIGIMVLRNLLRKMADNIQVLEERRNLVHRTIFIVLKIKIKFRSRIKKFGGPPVENVFRNRMRHVFTMQAEQRI